MKCEKCILICYNFNCQNFFEFLIKYSLTLLLLLFLPSNGVSNSDIFHYYQKTYVYKQQAKWKVELLAGLKKQKYHHQMGQIWPGEREKNWKRKRREKREEKQNLRSTLIVVFFQTFVFSSSGRLHKRIFLVLSQFFFIGNSKNRILKIQSFITYTRKITKIFIISPLFVFPFSSSSRTSAFSFHSILSALPFICINFFQFIILMGNKSIQGLSTVITKNWQPLYLGADVYKSKLTSQIVREQLIKIQHPPIFQDLRLRMKQTNPYICRVVFFSHYIHNLYYVFTEENRNMPIIRNYQQWSIHENRIIQAFIKLSKRYGYTKVCREMIGVDQNGQIKVWINPNTAICQTFCPCQTQEQMIADIMNISKVLIQFSSCIRTKEVKNIETINEYQLCSLQKNYNGTQLKKRDSQKKLLPLYNKLTLTQYVQESPKKIRRQINYYQNYKNSEYNTCESSERERQRRESPSRHPSILDISQSKIKAKISQLDRTLIKSRSSDIFYSLKLKTDQIQQRRTSRINPPINYRVYSLANKKTQQSANDIDLTTQTIKKQRNQYRRSQGINETPFDLNLLSRNLQDVKNMPVREQRESELGIKQSQQDIQKRRLRRNREKSMKQLKEVSLSRQLSIFFNDNDLESNSTFLKNLDNSSLIENLKKQVNQLFY